MNYDPAITQNIKNVKSQKDVDLWSIWNYLIYKILLIHGIKSQVLIKSTVEKMQKTKDLDLYKIKYAGHTPSLTNSNEIEHIKSWLEKL